MVNDPKLTPAPNRQRPPAWVRKKFSSPDTGVRKMSPKSPPTPPHPMLPLKPPRAGRSGVAGAATEDGCAKSLVSARKAGAAAVSASAQAHTLNAFIDSPCPRGVAARLAASVPHEVRPRPAAQVANEPRV